MTASSDKAAAAWLNPTLHWLSNEKLGLPIQEFTRIKPALGKVVLRMLDGKEVSAGGIIFPYGAAESTAIGVVEEVSAGYQSAPDDEDPLRAGPIYRVGDVVVISKYTGTELIIERKKRVICYESDILASLERPEAAAVLSATPVSGDPGSGER